MLGDELFELALAAFEEVEELGALGAGEGAGGRRVLELGDGDLDRSLADVPGAVGLRGQEEGLARLGLDHVLGAVGEGDLELAAEDDVDRVIGMRVHGDLGALLEGHLEDADALVVERLLVDRRADRRGFLGDGGEGEGGEKGQSSGCDTGAHVRLLLDSGTVCRILLPGDPCASVCSGSCLARSHGKNW